MRTKLSVGALLLLSVLSFFTLSPSAAWGSEPKLSTIAEVTSVIHGAKLEKTTDLVFLAEGYSKDEQPRFLADARAMTDRLERSKAAEPMRAARVFDYHFVFVPSSARA